MIGADCPHCGKAIYVVTKPLPCPYCDGRVSIALTEQEKCERCGGWTCITQLTPESGKTNVACDCKEGKGEQEKCERCGDSGTVLTKFMGSDSTREVIPCPDCKEGKAIKAIEGVVEELERRARGINTKLSGYNEGAADAFFTATELVETALKDSAA